MRAAIRTAINNAYTESPGISTPISLYLADAQTQTTATGQNRSAMNAFQHGLSGNRMILQDHELEAYRRLSSALHHDYAPATETERQFVQKIIDCHTRLNRIVAIENNILNIGVHQNTNPESGNDPATEAMIAQARTWTLEAGSFDKLGQAYSVHKGTRPHPGPPPPNRTKQTTYRQNHFVSPNPRSEADAPFRTSTSDWQSNRRTSTTEGSIN